MTAPLPRMLRPLTEDQRVTMERKWAAPRLAPRAQKPCDHGLFGDSHLQADLLDIEMFMDPTNEH